MSMKYYSIMTDLKPNYLLAILIKSFCYILDLIRPMFKYILYYSQQHEENFQT